MTSDDDFLLQLDELYSQPSLGIDTGVTGATGDAPIADGGATGSTSGFTCESFQIAKEAIELHRLRLQYSLEVNKKVRDLVRDMKQDIFSEQKQVMEMFRVEVASLKELGVDVG